MGKPTLLFIGPVSSCSGYGKHAADLVRSIINMNRYDVKILSLRWGNTPLNSLIKGKDDDILSRILPSPQIDKQPDILVQISVPNEFNPIGKYNIGITAGIETTVVPANFIEGMNRMNFNIVPSDFAKSAFITTAYTKNEQNTNRPIGQLKNEKPIEIVFEGCDTNIYRRLDDTRIGNLINDKMSVVKEDWTFLVVGHWLQGNIGHDRKDIGMTIKVFLEAFKNKPNAPAMVLKTSSATFSIMDRNEIINKILQIKSTIVDAKTLPNIYLIHGQLSDIEMNELYNHPKIKCMVTLTKGEGFGRPLLEFSMSGKPIIASGWSGHLDFLDKELSILLPGKLNPVDPSSVNDFILKEGQWYTADYNIAARSMIEVHKNYNRFLSNAKKLMYNNKKNFDLLSMDKKLDMVFRKYIPEFPEELSINLPSNISKIKSINLPKLKRSGV